MARFHAQHGTTALLATTITNPWERILEVLSHIRAACSDFGGAQVLGAHLEGPFLSEHKLGAQPPLVLEPTPERVAALLETGAIRVVTLAPEKPGSSAAVAAFVRAGVRVSLGHTVASAEVAEQVIREVHSMGGTLGGTHLFNGMEAWKGREPGVVGALLASSETYAEIILDAHHVHPISFRAVYLAKPQRLMLVSDAMRAAGMPDGHYDLGGQQVVVSQGVARLPHSLAGSLLTMDVALRNAVRFGLSLAEASRLVSQTPAGYLGLTGKGRLEVGYDADMVVLSPSLEVVETVITGNRVLPA